MKINIIVPFTGAKKMVSVWAFEEDVIDFRNDPETAARCTCSYAAVELGNYIARTLENAVICYGEAERTDSLNIELDIVDNASRCDEFTIEPGNNGLVIRGSGRTGLLYGAYEFLKMQGWRWYAPGEEGEIQPETRCDLVLPEAGIEYKPSMDCGRGFDFEQFYSKDSIKLWIWMSRNRMNMATYRYYTSSLCDKLGMSYKNGGHIFEKCLNPDRIMPSGKTLWEEHEDWFGTDSNGERKIENAQKIQFCVSNDELVEFLGDYLLKYLTSIWKYSDRVDIWGFDTWGQTCSCDNCSVLGNSTDQNLHFISKLRSYLNKARREGRLEHDVKIVFCGYEGTCTIAGPHNPVPKNILEAGDVMVFYPIRRCYAHDFSDKSCGNNTFYRKALENWMDKEPDLPIVIGEYYNVSKFEDLPIIFSERIKKDIPYYHKMGVRGATYMHLPMTNWGMRTLTQVLYSQLLWDVNTDSDKLIEEYFSNWYGPYTEDVKEVYRLTEEAWIYCSDWRAWGRGSVLSHLLAWDGATPEKELLANNHFASAREAVQSGRKSIQMLERAVEMMNEVRKKAKIDSAYNTKIAEGAGVNPDEEKKLKVEYRFGQRIGEDYRYLIYAYDTMKLMTEITAYHDALERKDEKAAERIWRDIEEIECSMESYYVPMTFRNPSPELNCVDALTRTQLGSVIDRCRKARIT